MPIETGIWKISKQRIAEKIDYSVINSEKCLENVIQNKGEILRNEDLLLGRQVRTSNREYIGQQFCRCSSSCICMSNYF